MTRVEIDGVSVDFPFTPYPIQVNYMRKVINCCQKVSRCCASLSCLPRDARLSSPLVMRRAKMVCSSRQREPARRCPYSVPASRGCHSISGE